MHRARSLSLALAFVFCIILAGRFFWDEAATSEVTGSLPTSVEAKAPAVAASNPADTPGRSAASERALFDLDAAVDYGTLREELRSLESKNDANALRMVGEIYEYCFQYSLNPDKAARQAQFLASLRPENTNRIAEIAKLQEARCKTVDNGKPVALELVEFYRERAAERGDRASALARFGELQEASPEEAERLVGSIAQAARPNELLALSQVAAQRTLPGEFSTLSGSDVYGHAWAVVACRQAGGALCGPSGRLMTQHCLATGLCNFSSYEDLVRRGLTPPSSLRDLDRAISGVQSQLRK